MFRFIARMNPVALEHRMEVQEQLTKESTAHAQEVLERRMALLDAEKSIRTRQAPQ